MPGDHEFGTGPQGLIPNAPNAGGLHEFLTVFRSNLYPDRSERFLDEPGCDNTLGSVRDVKKRDSWGPVVAALMLGLLTIMVVTAFYLGIRGLF